MTTADVSACNNHPVPSAIDRAKKSIAPGAELNEWLFSPTDVRRDDIIIIGNQSSVIFDDTDGGGGQRVFHDNVDRVPGSSFQHDSHGDSLPRVPTVLTGLLEDWPAFSNPGTTWSAEDLAARTAATTTRVSLDGGPSFARNSMCQGRVTLDEYRLYCESGEASKDAVPLYVFDPDIMRSAFASDEFSIPECFSVDAMACIDGTEYRPLPPAWLLVGVKRSGTPIHDHPLTVAWNALLVGCKLWCCLPPDVDESALLLNLHEDEEEFDLSALEWFRQCGELPESAKIIVQRPGEVVYLPDGWFHVVLNVETSSAISVSLALRRDLPTVLPLLMETDKDFATFWIKRLNCQGDFDDYLQNL
ncbi:hypothetical protein ACHAXR_008901 [Thalassiosira sp. AJA248-18]